MKNNTSITELGTPSPVPTDVLKPAPDNPRKIPQAAIDIVAESLKRFGWQQPIVIDGAGTIIAGHTRWLAARKLGLPTVPVITAKHLTPAEVRAYRIADNRTHDFTTWDITELVDQLDELSGEFSDVLGLADWEGIIDEWEDTRDDLDGTARREIDTTAKDEFEITVVFKTKDASLAQERHIMGLPGVVDVRHKR